MKTLTVWGIYQIEAPRSEIFVDQPCNSVGVPLLLDGLLASLGVGIVSRFRSSLLARGFPCTISQRVSACSTLIPRVKHSRRDERRSAISRAARQAFIHGSTTKHKASLIQLSACGTREVPSSERAHWLAILELMLPLLDQLSGLAQVLDLVTFPVRYSASQGMRGLGRSTHGLSHRSKAIIDQTLSPGMFVGDASCSFPVGERILLCFCGLPFQVVCSLPRFPSFDADRLMGCTSIADFSEGAACFCSCCFLCGPTIGESPASVGHVIAGAIQFVLQTVLVLFWARSSSSVTSEATACNESPSLKRHLFHGGLGGTVFLRHSIQGLYCLLVLSYAPSFASSFFL